MTQPERDSLTGHVAIVTGANHGIDAATAVAPAASGVSVLITNLRLDDALDPGTPETYRRNRARDAEPAAVGITANVVHTPVTDDVREMVAASTRLDNVAEPDEIADVITHLREDRARPVNRNILALR